MSMFKQYVAAAIVAMVAGTAAQAGTFTQNIYLTFSDPFGQREIRYTEPADATQLGRITYDTQVPVGLSFDLSDFGFPFALLITSNLMMDVAVGPASAGAQPNEYLAGAAGTYEFRRASDSALLISGSFFDASVSILRSSGGVTSNGLMNMGQFNVTFHPALLAEFSGFGFSFPGFDQTRFGDASWTLTSIVPAVVLVTPPGSSEQFFGNFQSNAAFSATMPVLPSPGAMSLIAAAGVVMLGVRRR